MSELFTLLRCPQNLLAVRNTAALIATPKLIDELLRNRQNAVAAAGVIVCQIARVIVFIAVIEVVIAIPE